MLSLQPTLIVLAAFVASALALPTELAGRKEENSAVISLCEAPNLSDCFTIPVVSDNCINLTGGLSFLNQEIDSLVIPPGFICSFFDGFSCLTQEPPKTTLTHEIALQGGTYNSLSSVPGDGQNVNFSNRISSFTCSTIF